MNPCALNPRALNPRALNPSCFETRRALKPVGIIGPVTRLTRSYTHGASHQPLLGDTIGEALDRTVARRPDAEALVVRHQDVRWTWAELKSRADACAAGLVALGLERGDRVGIWSPNNAEWVVAQLATARAGLILVNINPAYRVHELQYALTKVACKALITATSFRGASYLSMLRDLAPELDRSTPGELRAAGLPDLRTVIRIGGGSDGGVLAFDDVAGLGDQVSADWSELGSGTMRKESERYDVYFQGSWGRPEQPVALARQSGGG